MWRIFAMNFLLLYSDNKFNWVFWLVHVSYCVSGSYLAFTSYIYSFWFSFWIFSFLVCFWNLLFAFFLFLPCFSYVFYFILFVVYGFYALPNMCLFPIFISIWSWHIFYQITVGCSGFIPMCSIMRFIISIYSVICSIPLLFWFVFVMAWVILHSLSFTVLILPFCFCISALSSTCSWSSNVNFNTCFVSYYLPSYLSDSCICLSLCNPYHLLFMLSLLYF